MQDDVADAVQWAVARGDIVPKRVCIAGASYWRLCDADGTGATARPVPRVDRFLGDALK